MPSKKKKKMPAASAPAGNGDKPLSQAGFISSSPAFLLARQLHSRFGRFVVLGGRGEKRPLSGNLQPLYTLGSMLRVVEAGRQLRRFCVPATAAVLFGHLV